MSILLKWISQVRRAQGTYCCSLILANWSSSILMIMMSFAHSKPWQICNGKLPYTQIFWGESSPGLCEFLRPEFPDGNSNGSHALMWDTNHIVSLINQWPDIIRHSRHSNSYWNSVTWIGKSEYCMDLAALHLEPWTFLGFPTTTTQACACCSSPVHGNFDAIRTSQSSWTWIYIYIYSITPV